MHQPYLFAISMLRNQAQTFGVALVAVASALGLMLLLNFWLDITPTPFLLFFGALTVSAWYGGRMAGIFATILSSLVSHYFFVQSTQWFDPQVTFRTIVFIAQGILISLLCGALKTSQEQTRTSIQQLQISQKKLRRLIDSNIMGVISCNTQGSITEANDEFLRMTGFTQGDVLSGQVRWDAMTPSDLKSLDESALHELMTNGRSSPYEKAFIAKDGHRVPVIVGAALLEDTSDHVISFVLDLTQLKRAEQRLSIQFAVTRALAEAETLDIAVLKVLQALCESLGWQLGIIWQVDTQAAHLRCVKSWSDPHLDLRGFEASNFQKPFTLGVGLPGQVWAEGKPIWIANLETTTNFPRAKIAQTFGLHTVMGFPILLDQDVLGVIECFSTSVQTPNEDLLQLMTAIGSQIGQYYGAKAHGGRFTGKPGTVSAIYELQPCHRLH